MGNPVSDIFFCVLTRWRLAFMSLPFVCITIGLRFVIWYGADSPGWIDSSVFKTIISLATFVSALLVSGLVSDYKESEKLASELVCSFRDLVTVIHYAHSENGKKDAKESYEIVKKILFCTLGILDDVTEPQVVFQVLGSAERELFLKLDKIKGKTKKLSKPLDAIRKVLGRMEIIQSTTFVPDCYSLMESVTVIIFVIMTLTNWHRELDFGTALAFTTIITFLFTFLRFLVGVLDNPFCYPKDYLLRCYVTSTRLPYSLNESFQFSGAIDLSNLFVEFGSELRVMLGPSPALSQDRLGVLQGVDAEAGQQDFLAQEKTYFDKMLSNEKSIHDLMSSDVATPGTEGFLAALMRRWALTLFTVPVVLVMAGFRLAVWYGAGVGGWIEQGVFTSVIGLAIFVTGLLLNGLIADYKESEKMPSELLAALRGLSTAAMLAHAAAKKEASSPLLGDSLRAVRSMMLAVGAVMDGDAKSQEATNDRFSTALCEVNKAQGVLTAQVSALKVGFVDPIGVLAKPCDSIRTCMVRINLIKKTSYIMGNYSLSNTLIIINLVLMTIANWPIEKQAGTAGGFIVSITFLFTYLFFLIRKLEDPFFYPENYQCQALKNRAVEPLSWWQAARMSHSIKMDALTVDFNKWLHFQIQEADKIEKSASPPDGILDFKVVDSAEAGVGSFGLYFLQRWRLPIMALPAVIVLVGVRMAVWYGANVGGWVNPGVFTDYIRLVILVMTFQLAGVVQDYKESEKALSDMCAAVQGLVAYIQIGHKLGKKASDDAVKGRRPISDSFLRADRALQAVLSVIDGEVGTSEVIYSRAAKAFHQAEVDLHLAFQDLDADPTGINSCMDSLRKGLAYLQVVRSTSYIAAGYGLMDAMLAAVLTLMTVSNWPFKGLTMNNGLAFTVVITYLFSYIRLLISDLENPLAYPPGYSFACYDARRTIPISNLNTFLSGGSTESTSMLAVTCGSALQDLMKKAGSKGDDKKCKSMTEEELLLRLGLEKDFVVGKDVGMQVEDFTSFQIRKWRLALLSLSLVAVLIGSRLAVWYGGNTGGWLNTTDLFPVFLTLVIFVFSVVNGGLLQDYKESERMPADLAAAFYGLLAHVHIRQAWAKEIKAPERPLQDSLSAVQSAAKAVLLVLDISSGGLSGGGFEDAASRFAGALVAVDNAQSLLKARCFEAAAKGYKLPPPDDAFSSVRGFMARMYSIQRTTYLIECFTLLHVMVLAVLVLLVINNWPQANQMNVAISFTVVISFLFGNLELFIRALDDPFVYQEGQLLKTFEKGDRSPMNGFWYGGSIDFTPLTVCFGQAIRSEIQSKISSANAVPSPANADSGPLALIKRSSENYLGETTAGWSARRTRLILQTAPFVLFMVALRYALWYLAWHNGLISPTVMFSFVSLVIFVTSMLLGNVSQDYKEAEKLPGQLTVALENLATLASVGAEIEKDLPSDENVAVRAMELTEKTMQICLEFLDVQDSLMCACVGGNASNPDPNQAYSEKHRDFDQVYHDFMLLFRSRKPVTAPTTVPTSTAASNPAQLPAPSPATLSPAGAAAVAVAAASGSAATSSMLTLMVGGGTLASAQTPAEKPAFEYAFTNTAWDLANPLTDLRKLLERARAIKQTSMVLDSYVLVDGITLAVLTLLAMSDWSRATAEPTALCSTVMLSALFVYMGLVIRSLENPFKYPPKHADKVARGKADPLGFTVVESLDCGNPIALDLPAVVFPSCLSNRRSRPTRRLLPAVPSPNPAVPAPTPAIPSIAAVPAVPPAVPPAAPAAPSAASLPAAPAGTILPPAPAESATQLAADLFRHWV